MFLVVFVPEFPLPSTTVISKYGSLLFSVSGSDHDLQPSQSSHCFFDVDELGYTLCVYFYPMHSGNFCLVMKEKWTLMQHDPSWIEDEGAAS